MHLSHAGGGLAKMMDHHYPNSAWLNLDREIFDRLYAYKRSQGFSDWDTVIGSLLNAGKKAEVVA